MRNLLWTLHLGFFAGLGLAFFFNYFDNSLEMVEDVEEYLQIPVLASIQVLANRGKTDAFI